MRVCSKCSLEKELTEFHKSRRHRDGLYPSCKACVCKAVKKYREDNPDLIKQRKKEAAPRERDKAKARVDRFHQNNPYKAGAYRESYIQRHPENVRISREKWAQAHPEYSQIANTRRRSRLLNQFIEDVDPKVVYQMHGGMCGVCKDFVSEDDFHVDHVIPLAKGGMHGYVNVQPAHPLCNQTKGAKIL